MASTGISKSLWPDWSTGTMAFFWDSVGVPAALGRSVIVAAITVALAMLIGTPAGYAIARYWFRGKNAYQLSIVSTRAFPVVVLSIPLAVFFLQWGIYDAHSSGRSRSCTPSARAAVRSADHDQRPRRGAR